MAPSAMKKKARCKLAVREAYRRFADYYARDAREAAAVPADYLAVPSADGVQPRTAPIPVTEVPCVQMLSAGVAIMEDRPKLPSTGLTAEALRLAGAEGVRLRGLELNGTKGGKTVITAHLSFMPIARIRPPPPTPPATRALLEPPSLSIPPRCLSKTGHGRTLEVSSVPRRLGPMPL